VLCRCRFDRVLSWFLIDEVLGGHPIDGVLGRLFNDAELDVLDLLGRVTELRAESGA
jgi:hypothetical protein